jgi:hypothetical protein
LTEYVFQEYPKWIARHGVIVHNREQEEAVLAEPEKEIEVVKSADGDLLTVKEEK